VALAKGSDRVRNVPCEHISGAGVGVVMKQPLARVGSEGGVASSKSQNPLTRVWSEGGGRCPRIETPTGSRLEQGWGGKVLSHAQSELKCRAKWPSRKNSTERETRRVNAGGGGVGVVVK
jgi:hypothetical protein